VAKGKELYVNPNNIEYLPNSPNKSNTGKQYDSYCFPV
jgi:hypothetical protein